MISIPERGAHVVITHLYRAAEGAEPVMYTDTGRVVNHRVRVDENGTHVTGIELELDNEEAAIVIMPINIVDTKPYL